MHLRIYENKSIVSDTETIEEEQLYSSTVIQHFPSPKTSTNCSTRSYAQFIPQSINLVAYLLIFVSLISLSFAQTSIQINSKATTNRLPSAYQYPDLLYNQNKQVLTIKMVTYDHNLIVMDWTKMNRNGPELLQIGSPDPNQLSKPNGKQSQHRIVPNHASRIGSPPRVCKF